MLTVSAIRAKVARLLTLVRRYGVRSAIRRLVVARRSPMLGLSAAQTGLAHVTRVDRSWSQLVIHGLAPSKSTSLEGAAVVARHLKVIPVDVKCTDGEFELRAPLRQLSALDGVSDVQFVLSDGSKRWIVGRAPRPGLFRDGAVTVPATVVALPGGTFVRLRVKSQPEGELRVVSERMPGRVAG
jgi:hypothetical protein